MNVNSQVSALYNTVNNYHLQSVKILQAVKSKKGKILLKIMSNKTVCHQCQAPYFELTEYNQTERLDLDLDLDLDLVFDLELDLDLDMDLDFDLV